jgi:DNA polymerase III epsilon subunit-like protein
MQDEIYISVDIETAGPIPAEYSMLSLGASVVGQPKKQFYMEFKPINYNFVPAALEISRFDLETLSETGESPESAMKKFAKWIKQTASQSKPVFVGFNAGFDWSFVNWYFHKFTGKNPFGFSALDIKAYYMGGSGCKWSETTSSQLPDGFKPTQLPTDNALDDAIAQGEIFSKLISAPHS